MTVTAKRIDVAEDIVPIGHFKTHASEHIRKIHRTGRPLVITQNGHAAAVVLTPEEFEELGHRAFVRAKIDAGIRSAEKGPTRSAAAVEARVIAKIRRAARKKASR
jgi:prevent-host-death family protein